MNRSIKNRMRLISVTEGNLRNHHLYITGCHDFFPEECHGQSSVKKGMGHKLTLLVEGLRNAVETDIARDGGNGHARNFFRKRAWVGEFFEKHHLQKGDIIAIERLNPLTYRIYPFKDGDCRGGTAKPTEQEKQTMLLPNVVQAAAEHARSAFGDTAFTKNGQEPLHRWAESLFRERGNLA